jgi:hypothetical protein
MNDFPAIERLGIPAYNWWNESLHSVARAGRDMVFPQAIGLAATWDTDLTFRVARAICDEARGKQHELVRRCKRNIYQGLTFWTPNINLFRDPRWGRGMETYGEDPFLTGRMAVAFIKGTQGDARKGERRSRCPCVGRSREHREDGRRGGHPALYQNGRRRRSHRLPGRLPPCGTEPRRTQNHRVRSLRARAIVSP